MTGDDVDLPNTRRRSLPHFWHTDRFGVDAGSFFQLSRLRSGNSMRGPCAIVTTTFSDLHDFCKWFEWNKLSLTPYFQAG